MIPSLTKHVIAYTLLALFAVMGWFVSWLYMTDRMPVWLIKVENCFTSGSSRWSGGTPCLDLGGEQRDELRRRS